MMSIFFRLYIIFYFVYFPLLFPFPLLLSFMPCLLHLTTCSFSVSLSLVPLSPLSSHPAFPLVTFLLGHFLSHFPFSPFPIRFLLRPTSGSFSHTPFLSFSLPFSVTSSFPSSSFFPSPSLYYPLLSFYSLSSLCSTAFPSLLTPTSSSLLPLPHSTTPFSLFSLPS